ncbi:hypothetical protein F8B43_5196 [Methylorubrum populi]|uniref:Uncharacterized protein n=1 Tax=Methylorubrum populi TaxID=223967 RepID=A0A833MWP8_9HYPH|nr:hypothetical protein F8B43_5196 [Methylorubrum populi]
MRINEDFHGSIIQCHLYQNTFLGFTATECNDLPFACLIIIGKADPVADRKSITSFHVISLLQGH